MDGATEAVTDVLRGVMDPCSVAGRVPLDIVEMGLVRDVEMDADRACRVHIVLTAVTCFQVPFIEEAIERAVVGSGLARSVEVLVDHGQIWSPEMMAERARKRIEAIRRGSRQATGARRQQWREEVGGASAPGAPVQSSG